MFSVVRGYNVLFVILAQYLTAVFILAHNKSLSDVLLDLNLLMIVLASATSIASGYIINNFYDSEKDLINRPEKSMLDAMVSQNTKLSLYFILNFLAVFFASYVSFRAVVFFSLYIFGIWFYSHKLKKLPIIGNLVSTTLTVTPFFAVFIYYKNFESVIFVHAIFLFLILSMRELTKDLENIKGDLALNYKTIPIVYGEKTAKHMLTLFAVLTVVPAYFLIYHFNVGRMNYFFYLSSTLLLIFLILLWRSNSKKQYLHLHNMLKFILIAGVLGIILIDINVVLDRIL